MTRTSSLVELENLSPDDQKTLQAAADADGLTIQQFLRAASQDFVLNQAAAERVVVLPAPVFIGPLTFGVWEIPAA